MEKDIKRRVWEITSQCYDAQGNPIFTPSIITAFLDYSPNKSIIKYWAWVMHDKDTYTLDEQYQSAAENSGVPTVFENQQKPAHLHLVLEFNNQVYATVLQKCFPGLGIGQIQKPKAKYNQFLNICRYLTHEAPEEQAKGKHRYNDNEIHANFPFRQEVDKLVKKSNKAKTNRLKKSQIDAMINQVERGEITPEWIRATYGYAFYQEYQKQFDEAHHEYILRYHKLGTRYNIYVDAGGLENGGRVGKTNGCRIIARALYPDMPDSRCFYEIGDTKVALQQYAEQPVVIWNDMRAVDMIMKFGRPSLLNILDIHPGKHSFDKKYGDTVLINKYNLVNGIEPYDVFLNGLAGTYTSRDGIEHEAEDVSQIYGRFQFLVHVGMHFTDIRVNKGWYQGTRKYQTYELLCRIPVSIKHLLTNYEDDALKVIGTQLAAPILEKIKEVEARERKKISDPAGVRAADMPVALTPQDAQELDVALYKSYIRRCANDYINYCTQHNISLNYDDDGTICFQNGLVEYAENDSIIGAKFFIHNCSTPDIFGERPTNNPGKYTFQEWQSHGHPASDIPDDDLDDEQIMIMAEHMEAIRNEKALAEKVAADAEKDDLVQWKIERKIQDITFATLIKHGWYPLSSKDGHAEFITGPDQTVRDMRGRIVDNDMIRGILNGISYDLSDPATMDLIKKAAPLWKEAHNEFVKNTAGQPPLPDYPPDD